MGIQNGYVQYLQIITKNRVRKILKQGNVGKHYSCKSTTDLEVK